ncbi:MAG: KpsF/GutQ family sugar-phosphate isomerase [Betaproteobacteria bacterium]|nr:KpsF/GutQ family sugar-phosphate isomerase [Betaproteobacteria bacterium]
MLTEAKALALAHEALDIERDAVERVKARLGSPFYQACTVLLACTGRVVVSGMGKSGHIARKIAATLASTGTPAFFMHPAEASHGDLGMITAHDVVLAISNSGESEELTNIVPLIKRLGVPLVAMTGRMDSTLAQHADVVLDASVEKEACPLNLAPTASTTAQLALGDALAVVLLDARGFDERDFARSHPGGSLGRKLLTHVRDVMRSGDAVPAVRPEASFRDVLLEITRKGLGMTAVTDAQGTVLGIFTDGDLRRLFDQAPDTRTLSARDVMHAQPRTIGEAALAAEAVEMMERHHILQLLVTDARGRLVGALNMHDLFKAKVV